MAAKARAAAAANPLESMAPRHSVEEVCGLLASMRLPGIAQALRQESSDPGFAGLHFLDQFHSVLRAEANRRGLARYERNRKAAHFPDSTLRDLQSLGEGGLGGLTKAQRDMIGTSNWEGEQLIVILGKSGAGKSTLSVAMADLLLRKGRRAVYVNYSTEMFTLTQFLNTGHSEAWSIEIGDLASMDCLVLDDVFISGVLRGEALSLKELLDRCADTGCQVILCSQLETRLWHSHLLPPGATAADTNVADAVADRLSNGPLCIKLPDSTHRMRQGRVLVLGDAGGGNDGK